MGKQIQTILVVLVCIAMVIAVVAAVLLRPKPHEPLEPAVPEAVPAAELVPTSTVSIIGSSVEGRQIEAYTFGTGETKLLFVGGIHGGYEWNSVLLANDLIDYFNENPLLIPDSITVTIIPNLNPDALVLVTGTEGRFAATDVMASAELLAAARFNANDVDLNRNFDCKWAPESTWRGVPVSAGTAAFSEPEARALRDFVFEYEPHGVVFWHSQANTVYASECEAGILPETLVIMETYAEAASYNTQATFDAYPITGDAEGWLASIGIPAITVELETRTSTDWKRNVSGVTALLNYYTSKLTR